MTLMITKLSRRLASLAAVAMLVAAMGGSWTLATAAPTSVAQQRATAAKAAPPAAQHDEVDDPPARRSTQKQVAGKLNLNTATEEQLMMLPSVGPSKAERVIAWRKANGGFKRTQDLRRVKGFGYKTFKKLEPFLDIKGDTTLVEK